MIEYGIKRSNGTVSYWGEQLAEVQIMLKRLNDQGLMLEAYIVHRPMTEWKRL